jgi:cytochrome o ubiquinol oxidase subunit 1
MVAAIMAISFFSYIVWAHHFFTMGAGADVNTFFGIATMVIAIPTGVKIFNWLFTMFRGRVHFHSSMYWFMAFVVTFTIGGMTGVLHAIPAIDFQMHNSLFLVAHFHNMVIGGVVFGYMAGLVYWFPKIFGFRLVDSLGKIAAWCWTIGFMGAFIPLYILGIMGATRRLDHYDASLGWQGLFVVAGIGVAIIGLGVVAQVAQLALSIWRRKELRDKTGDPWNGRTLEWSVSSPAPYYNFAVLPHVTHRDMFWQQKQSKSTVKAAGFTEFELPKSTPVGLIVAACAFVTSFAIIWYIWWLAIIGVIGIVTSLLYRFNQEETEFVVTKDMLKLQSPEGHYE